MGGVEVMGLATLPGHPTHAVRPLLATGRAMSRRRAGGRKVACPYGDGHTTGVTWG